MVLPQQPGDAGAFQPPDGPQRERAAEQTRPLGELQHGRGGRGQTGPGVRKQGRTPGGEHHLPGQPFEQRLPQLLLQGLDLLADRGLDDMAAGRRPGERALLRHGDEVFERTELHGRQTINSAAGRGGCSLGAISGRDGCHHQRLLDPGSGGADAGNRGTGRTRGSGEVRGQTDESDRRRRRHRRTDLCPEPASRRLRTPGVRGGAEGRGGRRRDQPAAARRPGTRRTRPGTRTRRRRTAPAPAELPGPGGRHGLG